MDFAQSLFQAAAQIAFADLHPADLAADGLGKGLNEFHHARVFTQAQADDGQQPDAA